MAQHRNQQPQPLQVPVPLGMVPIPGLPDMQALQLLLAALGLNVMAILSLMQGGIPMHHVPQHAPQSLLAALLPPAPRLKTIEKRHAPMQETKEGRQIILNTWTDQLMPTQKTICAELQDHIHVVIYNLTGIIASDIGKPKDLDDEDSSDDKDET
ncbi:uncharacterized protein BJ212DRAFT_1484304 [Suillus subaureus]|uniref:Uncharacterized protein n=1 Tax=Suillus subaureus TaxID=48587 RepID=A0A9P7J9D8_9AGAM|nr:uncharacterized protein BJ212DRAFT_1484304 [Suillus subaureus]KAG1809599.1 hypothetical protein BJ212DRAFT_1484304 [Suillus subaureus]